MNEITLEHVKQACQWAKGAAESPQPIDGMERRYDQGNWDCGTSCCVWGAASIIAGNGPATSGPPIEWSGQSLIHQVLAGLMRTSSATPEQMEAIADLSGADLSGADLSGANFSHADLRDADFRGANLSGANFRGANLSGANLSGADISDANLSDAIIWLGNRMARLQ